MNTGVFSDVICEIVMSRRNAMAAKHDPDKPRLKRSIQELAPTYVENLLKHTKEEHEPGSTWGTEQAIHQMADNRLEELFRMEDAHAGRLSKTDTAKAIEAYNYHFQRYKDKVMENVRSDTGIVKYPWDYDDDSEDY